jgi:putative hydrolase
MSDFGFGFGPGSGGESDDLSGKMPLFAELQRLLSSSGGPVNWDLARQLAISSLAAGHRRVSDAEAKVVQDTVLLADLWLDEVTDMPSGVTSVQAWNQVDWVEKSIGTWATVCDPVARRVVAALAQALPPEISAQAGPMAPMVTQLGGLMFGAQLGQGLAALAGEVVSGTDVGLPLAGQGTAALVIPNVDKLAGDLERGVEDVRLFLALREAAHQRLYSHAPWLRQQLIDNIDAYGRGITIDPEAISSLITQIDPTDPSSMTNALAGGLFEPQNSEAQQHALRRLETLLALIEGWVDTVVAAAAGPRMAAAGALTEAIRRRRASGGPAEQTFATLVGLELRPRRSRDAAALWSAMTAEHGSAARDSLWNHPDLLPGTADLDEPATFASRWGGGHSDLGSAEWTLLEEQGAEPPASEDGGVDQGGDGGNGKGQTGDSSPRADDDGSPSGPSGSSPHS